MPRPEPLELVPSPGSDIDAALRALARQRSLHAGSVSSIEKTVLDTFDGRLRARGWAMWREGTSRRDGSTTLILECPPDGRLATTAKPGRSDRILAADLPPGVFRDRIAPILEERALLPLARIRSHEVALAVCNSDAKTTVRLVREEAKVAQGGDQIVLTPRLKVLPVLGYDRDFARVGSVLTGKGGLAVAPEPMSDTALRAAGRDPRGVSSDVKVRLDPTLPAATAMLAICRRLAQIVEANLPGTVADLDPEFLHDLRVAVRRTRSVLKEMKGVLDPDDAERSKTDLRWIQEITGPTRDLDVLLHDWPTLAAPVPDAMAADLRPLEDLLIGHRAVAFSTMRRHLRGRRFATAWAQWKEVIHASGHAGGRNSERPVGELAGRRIVSVYRAMVTMGSAINDSSPPHALHDLRKRGKELRYLLELFGGMWPSDTVKPLVTALKGLQDVLGHFQDDEIQVAEMRGLGPALAAVPGGTDSLIALGFVLDGLNVNQKQARESFQARFADFTRPATRAVVRDTFGGKVGGPSPVGRRRR